jgi:hypothetical protein
MSKQMKSGRSEKELAVVCGLLFIAVLAPYFMSYSPVRNESTGQVYDLNSHGTIRYLTYRVWLLERVSFVSLWFWL